MLSGLNRQSTHTAKLAWMLLLSQQLWHQEITTFIKQNLVKMQK